MLFTGTVTLGCKSYLDAQAKSCYCAGAPNSDSKNSKDSNYNKNNNNNKNTKPPRYNDKRDTNANNEKRDNDNFNTYPNNIPREQRTQQRGDPPSYGWKDKKDL